MADIPEKVAPLLDNTAIVNPNGTPSVYFLRQWLAQRVNNLSIEELIAEINALNARTLTAGVGLTGGGDLSADRTFDLANTAVAPGTYGDATHVPQFTVDQQGRITSVADVLITGGGGGGGSPEKFFSDKIHVESLARSGSAYASKGLAFQPLVDMSVHRASGFLASVNGASYTASICPIASINGTTITAAVTFSNTLVAVGTYNRWHQFAFATPVSLTAGNFYVLMISRADGGDTYVLPITFTTNASYPTGSLDMPVVHGTHFTLLDKAVPANGQTLVRSSGARPSVGMTVEVT